ncbi:MAG TPA: copper homeostasis protein CutC [Saprospiraceae bacterium]|nr:copper homeostasis protein CutC [Saprospiraceae bacterium]
MTLEACVESVDEAIHAVENGATQLEVCSNLEKDGLTPEIALIKEITEQVNVPIKVMIRLRAGNFTYLNDEIKSMQESIQQIKSLPISGLVFGATVTDANGNKIMDMNAILQICKAAHPIPVTIHKAIDECTDILKEVRALKTISNIAFILTSGGAKTAADGKKMIAAMQKEAGNHIQIIAAGKILPSNLTSLHKVLNLNYYHGRKIVG